MSHEAFFGELLQIFWELVAQMVKLYAVRLVYLRPYSPDVNRVEFAFRQRKNDTTLGRPAPAEPLEEAMQQATAGMWEKDAQNWFAHCGYHVH